MIPSSVQDPLDLDESGTVRSASSSAGWCVVVAALLVAVLCLAGCGGGKGRRVMEEADRNAWTDGRTYENTPTKDVSAARIAEQLRRIADALDRAFPDPSAPHVKKGG